MGFPPPFSRSMTCYIHDQHHWSGSLFASRSPTLGVVFDRRT